LFQFSKPPDNPEHFIDGKVPASNLFTLFVFYSTLLLMSDKCLKRIIDFHVHVFPDEVAPRAIERFIETYGIQPLSDGTVSGTLKYMDRVGVDIIVPMPVATKPSQVRSINDWAESIRSERVIPFGALHPDYDDIEGEINRLVAAGFPGIKLQPDWQEFYPDDERAYPIYEAAESRLAILFHAGREIREQEKVWATADRLLKVHKRFPNLTIIVAHMGGYREWHQAQSLLSGTDVYFDASYVPESEMPDDQFISMIRAHGVDKILFGSDFPFGNPAADIKRLLRLALTDDEREAIVWKNAMRLLSIEQQA